MAATLSPAWSYEWTLRGYKFEAKPTSFVNGMVVFQERGGPILRASLLDLGEADRKHLFEESELKDFFAKDRFATSFRKLLPKSRFSMSGLVVSPGGEYLVVRSGPVLRVVHLETGDIRYESRGKSAVRPGDWMSFSPDGKTLHISSRLNREHYRVSMNESGELEETFKATVPALEGCWFVAATNDDRRLVGLPDDRNHLFVVDLASDEPPREIKQGFTEPIRHFYVNPKGTQVVTKTRNWLFLHDLATGKPIQCMPLPGADYSLKSEFSGNGSAFYYYKHRPEFHHVHGWRLTDGGELAQWKSPPERFNSVTAIRLSPDGSLIAIGSNQVIDVMETATGDIVARFPQGQKQPSRYYAFTPDNKQLIIDVDQEEVVVIDLESPGALEPTEASE